MRPRFLLEHPPRPTAVVVTVPLPQRKVRDPGMQRIGPMTITRGKVTTIGRDGTTVLPLLRIRQRG